MFARFQVLVIGGGHAGAEAAAAAARMGARTLLVTPQLEGIGTLSCNPAIGGVAKGTVVREIDALGGIMGRATDETRIQFRMLNRSKGPAVWAPRAQCDRTLYPRAVRRALEEIPKLEFFQGRVAALLLERGQLRGVRTESGVELRAERVVLTTGTFLRGRIHIGGSPTQGAGRDGDAPSLQLAEQLDALGLEIDRFKTGTPPRIDGRSVDFSALQRQDGEGEEYRFSTWRSAELLQQLPCWITWTGEEIRETVQRNLQRSALYGGEIAARGVRYCPSIEDKIVKFPEAPRHQVFLEPEGLATAEMYVNGLSTSLPIDVQLEMLRALPGLAGVRMTKMGYAIEYDYFPPHQLTPALELKALPGLYLAGQVNGTTGYEEAAGQGLVAGANAAAAVLGLPPLVLGRDESFIGVMIDDLVTRGTDEPYRLFTSRAEFRLLLRQDNALLRLGPRAERYGLLTEVQRRLYSERLAAHAQAQAWLSGTNLTPAQANPMLAAIGSSPLREPTRLANLLRRPGVEIGALAEQVPPPLEGVDPAARREILTSLEMEHRYAGYLDRERERAASVQRHADFPLPADLAYGELQTLSTEARQKLAQIRPVSLGQAGRIPGLTPSDLQNLLLEVRKRHAAAARPVLDAPGEGST